MNRMKRCVSALLSLCLLLTLLSACAKKDDPIKEAVGIDGDTTFFTVNGEKVTAQDYCFWLIQNLDSFRQMYGDQIPWDEQAGEGSTLQDYLKSQSLESARLYTVVQQKAKELDYSISADDEKEYEADHADALANNGGEETYALWLKEMLCTDEEMRDINLTSILYQKMQLGLCRPDGKYPPTDEDLATLISDNGLLFARHILLATKNTETGEAMTQEQKDAQKKKAQELVDQIKNAEDKNAVFEKLMQENSEDPGLATKPAGYLFGPGEFVPEFENATVALAEGEVSDIVESAHGYHIIQRLKTTDSEDLLDLWAQNKMQSLLSEWVEAAEVKTEPAYDNFDVKDFYEKLTAYRESLQPAAEGDSTTPAEGDSAKPAEGDTTTPAEGDSAKPAEGDSTAPAEGDSVG